MAPDPVGTNQWYSLGLAFIGGYGDAAGYLVAKTFTGHVTGNLVLVVIDIVGHDSKNMISHFLAIIGFLGGVFLSALMMRTLNSWSFRRVLAIEIVLMCVATLAMCSHGSRKAELFVVCVALALGLQNGAVRRVGTISIHTTYLTGMITNLITMQTSKNVSPTGPPSEMVCDPCKRLLVKIWIVFVLGAGIGAATILHLRELGIAGEPLLLVGLLIGSVIGSPSIQKSE
jgi:uncharacterized membrane protein YoaK (UPF0700 family)